MPDLARVIGLAIMCVVVLADTAHAQSVPQSSNEGWRVNAYPILLWVPLDIDAGVDVPPNDIDQGDAGDILDSHLDGAFFGGVTASNGPWWIEGYAIWASFGGDRPQSPFLTVDMDLIYADAKVGRRFAPNLYVTGGVRRVALDYDITLGNLPRLSRKPGVWDPLVGIAWHRIGDKVEWHASFEGGGFGAGADVDLGAGVRVDWKVIPHFGLVAGYNFLYLKLSDTVAGRTVVLKPTLHGPAVGIGLYF